MKEISQIELISGTLKEIEKEIVTFYKEIGNKQTLNEKNTEIFAYFKLYQRLTQDQLKKLTNFSLSTISTTLQTFLQTDILVKESIPNSRTSLYCLRKEKVSLIYITFSHMLEEFEKLDRKFVELGSEIKLLEKQYKQECIFLNKRLNSLRNYIEAQRRAINGKKKYDFFEEDLEDFLKEENTINYPSELIDIEDKIIEIIIRSGLVYSNDPIKSKITSYFITRGKSTQQTLEDLTNFSRSTISRNLQIFLEEGRISALERKFRKPKMYYYKSASMNLIKNILHVDYFIFSWIPKFKELLHQLETNKNFQFNSKENEFLQEKIRLLIEEIENFKEGSKLLENALNELVLFLKE